MFKLNHGRIDNSKNEMVKQLYQMSYIVRETKKRRPQWAGEVWIKYVCLCMTVISFSLLFAW